MPLYTPLGGSWLNMAESIQRILKRRTLDGQHPRSPAEIGAWFQQTAEAWNRQPTPFLWNGKRRQRRRKQRGDAHPLGGSGAHTRKPLSPRGRSSQEWHSPRQLNDPRLQGEGFKRGRFEIDRRPRPPDLLLVMVPETTGKRCFGARTGQALKAQRATAAAVSSHDATSPILRFA